MSEDQGGSALRVIYFALLCLFLGSAILGFLLERVSDLQVFKSPTWLAVRTPVIVVSVLAFLAILVTLINRHNVKQGQAQQAFARSQGWVYTSRRDDPQGAIAALEASLKRVCPEKSFRLSNIVTVESGQRSITLFECWYRVLDWGSREDHRFVCLVESDRFEATGAQVDIGLRNRMDQALLSHQVDMGDSAFARGFIVTSKDPSWARHIVSESLQGLLLETRSDPPYSEINLGPGGALIIAGAYSPFERWLALVDLARRIEGALR